MKKLVQVSVVIPTLNEEANIRELCERLARTLEPVTDNYELVFIDDNSSDNSVREIEIMQLILPVEIRSKIGQKGKSISILEGIALAKYDIIAMIDADLQYPPEALSKMIKKLITNNDGVVVGQRIESNAGLKRKLGTVFMHVFFRLLFQLDVDVQSGIKVFTKSIAENIDAVNIGAWSLDLYLLQNARLQNCSIQSVDVNFDKRHYGRSKLNFFRDGASIIFCSLKLKFKTIDLPFRAIRQSPWFKQATRFVLVGILNTVIDITLFYMLTRYIAIFNANIVAAKVVSYGVAATNSFWLNRKYTFQTSNTSLISVIPYIAVSSIGAAINSAVLYVSIKHINMIEPVALALATLAAFSWNFTISKLYIFRPLKDAVLEP